MKYQIIDCEQGSDEWFAARLGKPTASVFDKVITKGKGHKSKSVDDLVNRCVAEMIVGEPDETFTSEAMLRGKQLESEALSFINFTYGYDFKTVGFLDSGLGYGASPDGLDLTNSIGLELKCPMPHTHLAYLSSGTLPDKYYQQVQGAMLVTGFDKWVFVSYHPALPCLHVVVERDNEFIAKMEKILLGVCEDIKTTHQKVSALVQEAS